MTAMRRILFLAVPLSLFATSIIIGLPGVGINPVSAQSVRPLPTQILTTKPPADITIIQGQNAVVGHGDFNGDGVADFLVAYRRTMTAGGSPLLLQFGIVFGKPHPTDRLTIDLTRRGPDVSLINPVKPPMGDSYIIKLDDLSGD